MDLGKSKSAKPRPSSSRKAGGQPGHTGKGRALFAEEQGTHFHDCYPAKRCDCGSEVRTRMWVAIAGLVSVFLARASRSAEVAQQLLGACFAGILISDRYAAA